MVWQTKSWHKMLEKSNQVEKIISLDDFCIEKRSIGLGQSGLFALGVNLVLEKNIAKLKQICLDEKCLFFQIENFSLDDKKNKINLDKGYYKKFIMPWTAVVDLSKSEDDILANMKPKGRYNIKLAVKKEIIIKDVEKTDDNIKIFYDLMCETTTRDNFSGNTLDYYKTFLNNINNSKLLIAYFGDIPVAAGIFIIEKEVSFYYYGASTTDKKYRNLMAPYLLQWEAIKLAKSSGSKFYDFLGVATPGDLNSPLKGVTDFKSKLTKDIRQVSESYIWINNKFKYNLFKLIRNIKNKIC